MRLETVDYAERVGTPMEWTLKGLSLGTKTLIVGKNATGKTRALNIISALARNLAALAPPSLSANYHCVFSHGKQRYEYFLEVDDEQVVSERLLVEGVAKLSRGAGGVGEIWADQIDGGKLIAFQAPPKQFAAVARRDTIQHAFLEPLYEWASSLRHYHFGTHLGKDTFGLKVPNVTVEVDERDTMRTLALFRRAREAFGEAFLSALIQDLAAVDYHVESIDTAPPISMRVHGAPGEVLMLVVKERDLPGLTDQASMSQGMFRVLALLTQLNYVQLRQPGACLLIDDIGEGLDFDRSCRLVQLLREKADRNQIQLVMSTNDRFIMNEVPLEEWSVLQRKQNHVRVRNYANSREEFEQFKFTGLSNFSLLELDVLNQDQQSPDKP